MANDRHAQYFIHDAEQSEVQIKRFSIRNRWPTDQPMIGKWCEERRMYLELAGELAR